MLVEEKMMENRYLVTVVNKGILESKVKNVNFLFPIEGYSVGYRFPFSWQDIEIPHSYVLINRVLDKEAISHLRKDLKGNLENIEGICFTDLGVLEVVRELNLDLKLIYMQNHNATNRCSINYYLEYVDSVMVSTDITKEEIMTILDASNKPLVVPFFGKTDVMYSRRTLLSNFREEFGLGRVKAAVLHEPISNQDFFVYENEFGTVFYADKFIDCRSIKHKNILFYYINPIGLSKECLEKIINGEDMPTISDTGFLDKKTYYRLKEEK